VAHDLATPPFAIRHSIVHLKVDPDVLKNISYTYYEGGHMMYTIDSSNEAFNGDIARFVTGAANAE